jgi:Protein of unknown function (DUF992)
MRIECEPRAQIARDFTFQFISVIGRLGLLAGAALSSVRMRAITCTFLAVPFSPATAQARLPFRIGGLTCRTDPRVGLVLGSRQDMRFVFDASAAGQQYVYTGTIRRLGRRYWRDKRRDVILGCFARNSQIGRGTLRGIT